MSKPSTVVSESPCKRCRHTLGDGNSSCTTRNHPGCSKWQEWFSDSWKSLQEYYAHNYKNIRIRMVADKV